MGKKRHSTPKKGTVGFQALGALLFPVIVGIAHFLPKNAVPAALGIAAPVAITLFAALAARSSR